MRQSYIVLQNTASGPGIVHPWAAGPGIPTPWGEAEALATPSVGPGIPFPWGAPASASPPRPRISVEALSVGEAERARRDGDVAAIAPAMPIRKIVPVKEKAALKFHKTPSLDPDLGSWGLEHYPLDEWTGKGVKVAVLDTGIHRAHQAFAGLDVVEKDFSDSGNGDKDGHGTHVAATIAGRVVNGKRIGVAPGVEHLYAGKVLGDDGGGSSEMIANGIDWAIKQGAHVINMSLGFDFPGLVARLTKDGWPVDLATSHALVAYRMNADLFSALMAMVQARGAFGEGCLLIAASGNEAQRHKHPGYDIAVSLPASTRGIVSVGALGKGADGLKVAPFSNTGPTVSAPGVDIVSAKTGTPDELVPLSGTSMASPHVAGAAALWWQKLKEDSQVIASAENVRAELLGDATTVGLDAADEPEDRGKGLVLPPIPS